MPLLKSKTGEERTEPAPTPRREVSEPSRVSKRLAPIVAGGTALAVALGLRQVLGLMGMGEATTVYTTLNVTGVLTLGVVLSVWAGRLSGRVPGSMVMGGLAGATAGSFAHETIPAIAGGVILGFLGFRILSRVLSWAMLYVVALIYGGGVGVGAHYLITKEESWIGYPQAGLAVLIGVALAAYLANGFGEEENGRRFAGVWNTWIKANRLALVGCVMLGLSGALYGLRGRDLTEMVNQIRTPIEEKVAEFQEVSEKVETVQDFKSEVDRILGSESE